MIGEAMACDACGGTEPPRNPLWRSNTDKLCDPCWERIHSYWDKKFGDTAGPPRTEAGRRLLAVMNGYDWPQDSADYILAIEAQAAQAQGAAPRTLDHTFTTPDGRTHCRCGVTAIEGAASSAPQALDVDELRQALNDYDHFVAYREEDGRDVTIKDLHDWAERWVSRRLAPSEPTETGEPDQP